MILLFLSLFPFLLSIKEWHIKANFSLKNPSHEQRAFSLSPSQHLKILCERKLSLETPEKILTLMRPNKSDNHTFLSHASYIGTSSPILPTVIDREKSTDRKGGENFDWKRCFHSIVGRERWHTYFSSGLLLLA